MEDNTRDTLTQRCMRGKAMNGVKEVKKQYKEGNDGKTQVLLYG